MTVVTALWDRFEKREWPAGVIRRPFYIQLDGEGDQNDILAGLGGQFMFRGGDGAQQILTAVEFGIVIHMYMAHRSSTGLTKEKMSMSGV